MRGATRVSLQLQQLLRLPQKMTLVINPLHTWNAIYTARSNKCHYPNWPNIAPATKQESQDWSLSTLFTMRGRSENDPRIRSWSENETVTPQPASQTRLLFTPTTGILYWKIQHFALRLSFQISPNTAATKCDCHDWSSSHMKRYLQCAGILRLPRQMIFQNFRNILISMHDRSETIPFREWSKNETVTLQPAS